ncbi:sulfotransferase [Sphaerisporangium rhizosphaerae]|uniref:Sulfotransferase n=1 Tax=Sphaerisporangium rhizosphaerae TaxID=2269375 RepID=A0ABW2PDG7_9ACTN
MTDRPRVLYITGWLRSGSTLLGNVLNELPGVLHAGELHYLWQNGVLRAGTNSVCGCGEQVRACPLWSAVLASTGEEDLAAAARGMTAAQRRLLRTRHTRARLAETRSGRPAPAPVAAVLDRMAGLYRELAARGGERLVVDGSKYPAEAAALLGRDDLDVRVLHVVRDPRATALSYHKSKQYISPMSPAASTAYWTGFNVASELVGSAAGDRYLRVRHEDLCAAPAEVVERVIRFAGLDDATPVDAGGTVHLGGNHTVTGNPDRLRQGAVAIRPDERWRTDLPARHTVTATALALPLLPRYGYPVQVPGRRTPIGKESLRWTSD